MKKPSLLQWIQGFALTVFLVGFFQSSAVSAEEIRIRATVGEKTTSFQVHRKGDDFILQTWSSKNPLKTFTIGRKNYEFILASVTRLIPQARENPTVSSQTSCQRDLAEVEIQKESSKVLKTRLCLFSETPQSRALLDLLKVLGMSTI